VPRIRITARLQRDPIGILEEADRLFGPAEEVGEPTEVVQQPADVRLVGELLVTGPRALGIRPREHPVAFALSDQRRLEVDVRDGALVVDALRELERALDILAGRLPVALATAAT